ncbi:MAG: hypothetical protein H6907_15730 [Hyphomicrobiales bacterium]|nr:hypothetical protein [Hyphomicrobiales bacterium]MCP5373177.1 hypothetical protein [Hyphomicrobiales bacterium]
MPRAHPTFRFAAGLRPWLRRLAGALVGAAALAAAAAAAAAAQQEPPGDLFYRLLDNPDDVTLNLLYARQAEEKNRLGRARAAYERILMADPDNAEARAALARIETLLTPDRTDVALILGAQYQTNSERLDDHLNHLDEGAASAQLFVQDDRRLGARRWVSNLSLFASLHDRYRDGDLAVASASTGPRLRLSPAWSLRPAIKGTYSRLSGDELFAGGSVLMGLRNEQGGLLARVDLELGYENYASGLDERDGVTGALGAVLAWHDLAWQETTLELEPAYSFKAARTGEYTYHSAQASLTYSVPLASSVMAIIAGSADLRYFDGASTVGGPDRQDLELVAEARLLKANVFRPNISVIGTYRFERNFSNNDGFDYTNHTVGADIAWTF